MNKKTILNKVISKLANYTYDQAKNDLLDSLELEGWVVNKFLKVPWASPDKKTDMRLFFKSQSIYKGQGKPVHSLHTDMKKLAELSKTKSKAVSDYLKKELFKS
jgi:hypothetical protein